MNKSKEKKSFNKSFVKSLALLFIFTLVITGQSKLYSQDAIQGEQAVEKYGWAFRNFSDTLFGWDIYCHTFFGVPTNESSSWITDVFDKAFYELAFKTTLPAGKVTSGTIVGGGNCFGMGCLSLMINKYGGYYGFCAPPMQYSGVVNVYGQPTYPGLKRIINIMHGRQLGLAALQTFIDQLHSGHSTDASYGLTLTRQAIDKEGAVLVSINRGVLTMDGHVLIAYKVTDEGGGKSKIWIVDPNRIWTVKSPDDSGYYTSASNYIDINGSAWSFLMAGKKSPWPCDNDTLPAQPLTSGSMIIFPISVVGTTQRTPSSMGVSILGLLAQICIWGNSLSPNYDLEKNPNNTRVSGNTFIIAKTLPQPVFEIPRGLKFNFRVGVYNILYPY
jgi:hypothetical protein